MAYHEGTQPPVQIRVPRETTDQKDYWRFIADHFEELARSCLFCNFIAKHRGSLKRHMLTSHNVQ